MMLNRSTYQRPYSVSERAAVYAMSIGDGTTSNTTTIPRHSRSSTAKKPAITERHHRARSACNEVSKSSSTAVPPRGPPPTYRNNGIYNSGTNRSKPSVTEKKPSLPPKPAKRKSSKF